METKVKTIKIQGFLDIYRGDFTVDVCMADIVLGIMRLLSAIQVWRP
jgi:hypothetical protein